MNAVTKHQDTLPGIPEAPASVSLIDAVLRAARDPHTDVEKMERLMAMAERMESRKADQLFDAALMAAQEEMGPVRADASNKQTNSKYATYGALDKAIRPVYTKHGFAISYDTGEGAPADMLRVLAYVSHREGTRRTYKIDMPADGKGAKGGDVMTKTHATGSAFSYGQRYLLKGIFNIVVGDDDDGNGASNRGGPITSDQAATIRTLIERTGSDIERFCKYFKIDAVPDLPAKEYERAIANLNLKAAGLKK